MTSYAQKGRNMPHLNFVNRYGRTYLVENPNNMGKGKDIGYYRELAFGGYKAVFLTPLDDEDFGSAEECQEWLKSRVSY